MVKEAVDNAIRQLAANGGGRPVPASTYGMPARTAEEIRAQPADTTTARPVQPDSPDIATPDSRGWAF